MYGLRLALFVTGPPMVSEIMIQSFFQIWFQIVWKTSLSIGSYSLLLWYRKEFHQTNNFAHQNYHILRSFLFLYFCVYFVTKRQQGSLACLYTEATKGKEVTCGIYLINTKGLLTQKCEPRNYLHVLRCREVNIGVPILQQYFIHFLNKTPVRYPY